MDTKLIKKLIRCYFFKNYYTNISFYRNASLASKQQTPTLPLPSCLRIPTFCITAKSLFTTLEVSDMVTDKVTDIYCR